jgi:hypothetical protein
MILYSLHFMIIKIRAMGLLHTEGLFKKILNILAFHGLL